MESRKYFLTVHLHDLRLIGVDLGSYPEVKC